VKREQLLAAVRAALATQTAKNADRTQQGELRTRYESLTAREREVFEGWSPAGSTSRSRRN
jgi:FixJ family two-component response regulator